jgi:hypothetical protein
VEAGSDQHPGDAYVYALRDEEAYLQTDEDEKPGIIAEPPPDPAWFKCSFCRRTDRHVLFGAEYPVRDPTTFAVIALRWRPTSGGKVGGRGLPLMHPRRRS